jgi:hypothetical protein
MGLTKTYTPSTLPPHLKELFDNADPLDITFCAKCAKPYPLRRHILGYTCCLTCGETAARSQSNQHLTDNHTVREYRTKHTDLYGFIHTGTNRRTI